MLTWHLSAATVADVSLPFSMWSCNGSFLVVSIMGVHTYLVNFIGIEDQDYGGFSQVAGEGLSSAFATFTLCWMITYSLAHAEPIE